jgi:tetratricopeptide (TPR) repeat protein
MGQLIQQVKDRQEAAKLYRKKGDAFRKTGREEEAAKAYQSGVEELNKALEHLSEMEKESSPETFKNSVVPEFVETFGAKGGLLQRLGKISETLDSYSKGAELEEKFELSNTYNRLNVVKQELLTGNKTIHSLEPQIRRLEHILNDRMATESTLSDSGWTWADLGDCRTLLGDLTGAEEAYEKFMRKAEIKSPERTLAVLTDIAEKLSQTGDSSAGHLTEAIDFLRSRLQ